MFENINFIKTNVPFVREYDSKKSPCIIFRKKFNVKNVNKAVLSVCGLGIGYYYINGKSVTDDLFTAPVSDYNKTLWFNSYDVTALLNIGENICTVMCGNGFFNESFRTSWNHNQAAWRDNPKFILNLDINGESVLISDENWKCTDKTPIIFNHLRSGEHFDSRLFDPNFNTMNFNDNDWHNAIIDKNPPKGLFRECNCEPIRICDEYKTVKITQTGDKKYVFDIGQNISGFIRLKVCQKSGDQLIIRYSEQIHNDYSLQLNDMEQHYPESEFMTDKFICNGQDFTWQPKFVYHGFRYVEIDGIENPDSDTVTGIFVHQDIKSISDFECSDQNLNKLYKIGKLATYSNMFYSLTDCPTREKLGWANDAQSSTEQILINFNSVNFFKKWNTDICDAMADNGAMPGIIPTNGWGFDWGNGPVSDGILFELPYKIYLYTSDNSLLIHNLPYFERYLNYLETRLDSDGMINFGLDDWACPTQVKNVQKTPLKFINTVFLIKFLRIAKIAADFAKNTELKNKYTHQCEKIEKLFEQNFINDDNSCKINEQTAVSMAIYHNLYKDIEPMKLQLKTLIEENDFHHNCGMVGLRHLFIALNKCNLPEYAYKIIKANGYPSFSEWFENEATTLWENWEIPGSSKNHHMYSDFMSWILKTLVGINISTEKPGYEQVTIKPAFIEELTFCKGYTETKYGKIEVEWSRNGDKINLNIQLPMKIEANIIHPENVIVFCNNRLVLEKGTITYV